MPTRPRLLPAFLLLAGFTASACTAILVPDEQSDGVQRCNNSEDCDPIDDNRYVAQCVFGEGQPENTDKVCVADFDDIPCGGMAYGADHPLTDAHNEALDAAAAYGACSMENRGKEGCQPLDGQCDPGLEFSNEAGACINPDSPRPAIYPPAAGGIEIAGQDVKDQFCRWYFCDEDFVCARSGSQELCQPCERGEAFGGGGCGDLFIEGAISPFYVPTAMACNDGGDPTTEAVFGAAPVP